MANALRLSELSSMTRQERSDLLRQLAAVAAGGPNGHSAAAAARIRVFEDRYEMSSVRMVEALRDGKMRETAERSGPAFLYSVTG